MNLRSNSGNFKRVSGRCELISKLNEGCKGEKSFVALKHKSIIKGGTANTFALLGTTFFIGVKHMKEKRIQTFTEYVNNFDMNEVAISRKYYHSLRVMDIAELIARNENFSEKDIELSILIGLLHDYARFPQWRDNLTYIDNDSCDHGDLAVKLLFDKNEIEKFYQEKKDYDELYDAIKYHNKMSIKNNLSVHNNKLCKMIRDADKLDIFYIFTITKDWFQEDENEINEKIKESFYKEEQASYLDVLSHNDKIVLDFSLVFDINYKSSLKYIKENKLIEKMYENLENKAKFYEYYEYVLNYINERID